MLVMITHQEITVKNSRTEPNLFVTTLSTTRNMHRQGKKVKGKRKPMKSKPVIKVGGRRVSAAPKNKTKYSFPVEVSYKNV